MFLGLPGTDDVQGSFANRAVVAQFPGASGAPAAHDQRVRPVVRLPQLFRVAVELGNQHDRHSLPPDPRWPRANCRRLSLVSGGGGDVRPDQLVVDRPDPHLGWVKGRWSRETCYAVTSLTITQASHAQLAAIIRGHWGIEDRLHWATWTSTKTARRSGTGSGPRIMASLRNLVITILRLTGAASIAAALRYHARRSVRPLQAIMRC